MTLPRAVVFLFMVAPPVAGLLMFALGYVMGRTIGRTDGFAEGLRASNAIEARRRAHPAIVEAWRRDDPSAADLL